ncbi:rRNA maturation RNase YbeY [Polynucleobacter sp. MWH-UH25E]|jgi:probable rRNA maturation factor|uniref:rRNA maturation RNase YbeY n=1 Tax=Polynucleobacter sp. MWH-UH25E TaxID=1855616 RepID=UPI001BFD0BAD|nr:rRNA maturation RNase YbeY [Polynucleobacter sp. MWH-UH25E]QWD62784.1 rRNA maturation RNase YbeY [Polynucleobacter sp. MWH-UH25E]
MPAKLIIDLQFASPTLESAVEKTASAALIKKWVKSTGVKSGLITLRFVNAAEGKKLNASFRKKDYATNVLTFPYEHSKNGFTADIIFCLPIIQKEARDQEKTLKAHLAHLIIHGCLHAQGYDHENDRDAKKMEALEIKLLKTLGFTNPYLNS